MILKSENMPRWSLISHVIIRSFNFHWKYRQEAWLLKRTSPVLRPFYWKYAMLVMLICVNLFHTAQKRRSLRRLAFFRQETNPLGHHRVLCSFKDKYLFMPVIFHGFFVTSSVLSHYLLQLQYFTVMCTRPMCFYALLRNLVISESLLQLTTLYCSM